MELSNNDIPKAKTNSKNPNQIEELAVNEITTTLLESIAEVASSIETQRQETETRIVEQHLFMGTMAISAIILGVVMSFVTVTIIISRVLTARRKRLRARTTSTIFVFETNQ